MGGTPAPGPAVRGRARARARPTSPRPWRPRPACRSSSSPRPPSSPCTTARPPARSARYFRALRKAARAEGGAIGFIEEIDAIAVTRGGLCRRRSASRAGRRPRTGRVVCGGLDRAARLGPARRRRRCVRPPITSEGVGGVVNELLVQMQSFDTPTGWQRARGARRRRREPAAARRRAGCRGPGRSPPTSSSSPRPTAPKPRPGPAAARPLRPPAHLRPAGQGRTPPARRPLPGAQGARGRARRARAPGRAGRHHHRLHPGHDRAPARRGAGPARCAAARRTHVVGGRRAGPPGHRGRPRPARRVHRAREAADRHARGGPRRGRLAGRAAAQARGAHDRQARRLPRAAGARRPWTTSTPARARELLGLVQIAFGGQVAEELFFGDVSTGPGRRPRVRHRGRGADGRRRPAWPTAWSRSPPCTASSLADPGFVGRVLGDPEGRRLVEELLHEQRDEVRDAARRAPPPRRRPARRAARAARARRPRDHRRPRGHAGRRSRPWDGAETSRP